MSTTMRVTALPGADVFASDGTIESVFGDLKARMLLEAIWNVYQAPVCRYAEFVGMAGLGVRAEHSKQHGSIDSFANPWQSMSQSTNDWISNLLGVFTVYFSRNVVNKPLHTCLIRFGFGPWQIGSEKQRVKFFTDDNNLEGDDSSPSPFATRKKNIQRHELNNRYQSGVKAAYKASLRMRGIVEGVRGEAWFLQPQLSPTGEKLTGYQALSFASLTESFYAALVEDPSNVNLKMSLSKGLECRILNAKMPAAIIRFLVNLNNRFHNGSGTSFIELMKMIPDATSHILVNCKPCGWVVFRDTCFTVLTVLFLLSYIMSQCPNPISPSMSLPPAPLPTIPSNTTLMHTYQIMYSIHNHEQYFLWFSGSSRTMIISWCFVRGSRSPVIKLPNCQIDLRLQLRWKRLSRSTRCSTASLPRWKAMKWSVTCQCFSWVWKSGKNTVIRLYEVRHNDCIGPLVIGQWVYESMSFVLVMVSS